MEVLLYLGNESNMDKARKSVTNSEIVSISKKITTLEMKELNERQRAEHAQKMYEHAKTSLKQMEERNIELETKFAEVWYYEFDHAVREWRVSHGKRRVIMRGLFEPLK